MADFAEGPAQREAMIDTALASADKAIALAPDLPDGYLARSGIRFRMRWNWQGTHDDLALAKELDPNRAETFIGYAMVSFSLGLRDEGLAAARKAVALDPLEVGAWSSLGRLSEAAGEIAEAKRAWTRALAISPQHVWANFMFGNRLLKEGDIDGAITRYQRIAEPWSSVGMALGEFSRGNDGASRELLATLEKDHVDRIRLPDRAGVRLARREGSGLRLAGSQPTRCTMPAWSACLSTRRWTRCAATRASLRCCAGWDFQQ
jgi:tetratricopeptide (TPR) repeat protein